MVSQKILEAPPPGYDRKAPGDGVLVTKVNKVQATSKLFPRDKGANLIKPTEN